MLLFLPESPLGKERILFVIQMGHVDFFQSAPLPAAFLRCQLRSFIDDMLELIHHRSIWDKTDRILQLHA